MSAPWWDDDNGRASSTEYRVHVGNLSWRTDESSLKDAFANYDPIYAQIIIDQQTGRSRGFGFVIVNFKDSDSMYEAIEGLDGRSITVNKANDRPRRSRRSAARPFSH